MNTYSLIGIHGLIGAGKTTVANKLKKAGYVEFSFAKILKDVVSTMFFWDRVKLDGLTIEDRIWRETPDEWWSNRLNIPNLSPRWVLQNFGTETVRNHFHEDMWVASLERHLLNITASTKIVISDCRLPNEFDMIKNCGGIILSINRPDSGGLSLTSSSHISEKCGNYLLNMSNVYYIDNNSSIKDLNKKVNFIIRK